MFKLTVVSGPQLGTSYILREGETTLGRASENHIVLPSHQISKHHCALNLKGDMIQLKDQGSANGTYVNGALTRTKSLKSGDRISLGEFVLEISGTSSSEQGPDTPIQGLGNLLDFPDKRNILQSQTPSYQLPALSIPQAIPGAASLQDSGVIPDLNASSSQAREPLEKLLASVEANVMPFFYNIILKSEWKYSCLAILCGLVLTIVIVSTAPMITINRDHVMRETIKRAKFMAKEIADRNGPPLAARNESKTEIYAGIENSEGVREALLADLKGRVIAPPFKVNQYLAQGPTARAALKAAAKFREGYPFGIAGQADAISVVAIEPIKVVDAASAKNITIAMAIVSVDFTLGTLSPGEIAMNYAFAFAISGIFVLIVIFIIYKMTFKPLQVLNEDMDKVLKGELPEVTNEFKFQEIVPLIELINSTLQRIPKKTMAGGEVNGDGSEDGPSATLDDFLPALKGLAEMATLAMSACDASKKITYLNSMFEEITGIRSETALGQEFSVVARDQAWIALTEELFARVQTGTSGTTEDFEFSGTAYKVHSFAVGSLRVSDASDPLSGPTGGGGYVFLIKRADA